MRHPGWWCIAHRQVMSATTPTDVLDPLMTAEEVSAYLGVPVKTLYNWRSAGKGPVAIRPGRQIRYPRSAVAEYVRSLSEAGRGA